VVSRRLLGVAVAVAAALALAACGDDSGSSSATTAGAGTTAAASATTQRAAQRRPPRRARAERDDCRRRVGQRNRSAADNATLGQQILVNSAGMTVYLFEPDATATTSAVPAGIKANWPPVVADGTPVAGDGVDASKLGVAPQADGTQQVTYNGHLLYTFISDVAPGARRGRARRRLVRGDAGRREVRARRLIPTSRST
jgi:predicted lipoprotein with Yx(FWY)xxD motif